LTLEYNSTFRKNFGNIWDYISKDSVNRANSFKNQIKSKLNNLENSPYKYRKSFYYDDDNIRDCIYKGYTIPYLIDPNKNKILIIDIFKWSNRGTSS